MKKINQSVIAKICLWLGIGLLMAAAAAAVIWQNGIRTAQEKAQAYVQTIRTLIPEPQSAVPEARLENTMSVLAVDGKDFVGILEMPGYGSALPVCAEWGKPSKYPCSLSGSIYDRTLQIGATTQKGQYEFYRSISVGDTVCFTDVEGNRYTLGVTALN